MQMIDDFIMKKNKIYKLSSHTSKNALNFMSIERYS